MTTETILQFFFRYNSVLVESLVVLILLFASLLTFRSFKQSKNEGTGGGGADLSQIEESLKKILERANSVPAAAAAAASGGGEHSGEASAALSQELNALKEELRKKQLEIEEARTAASSAATSGGMSDAEKANLESKIGDLERKLSEFDIISQDIADLTKYRDENAKLKEEIEGLKKGGGASTPAPAPAAAPTPEPAPASAAPAHDPMDNLFNPPTATDPVAAPPPVAAAPTPEPAAVAAPVEAPAQMMEVPPAAEEPAKIDSNNVVDDDLMAEFAAALAEQSGTPAPAPKTPAVQAAPAAPVEPPVTPQDKDLIGQFESFVKDDKSEPAKGS